MLGLALLLSASVAGAPPFHGRLVEQGDSLGGLIGFAVQADVHVDGPGRPSVSGLAEAVEAQMATALRARGIPVVDGPARPGPATATLGYLMIDIHVAEAGGGTAIAWTLHGSQVALLGTGNLALATTWEAGDLLVGAPGATAALVRDSLQPALDEFCRAVLSKRPVDPGPAVPDPKPSPAPPADQPVDL